MKIEDGIKLEGNRIEIPNCGRDDLPNFFKERGYKVGAEIGVYRGQYTRELCEAGLKVYAIDPWINYKNYRKHPKELPYNKLFRETKEKLKGYDYKIVKKTSMKAIEDFEDESLDFIYIDSNHAIRYIIEDIYEWHRKLKSGGVLSGHDYAIQGRDFYGLRACHVKFAVDLCARLLGIKKYYILGSRKTKPGEVRDRRRSWMWIKE